MQSYFSKFMQSRLKTTRWWSGGTEFGPPTTPRSWSGIEQVRLLSWATFLLLELSRFSRIRIPLLKAQQIGRVFLKEPNVVLVSLRQAGLMPWHSEARCQSLSGLCIYARLRLVRVKRLVMLGFHYQVFKGVLRGSSGLRPVVFGDADRKCR